MLEITFKNPHWASEGDHPSCEGPVTIKQVTGVVVKAQSLILQFPTAHIAARAGQFLFLRQDMHWEDVIEIPRLSGRWHLNYKFYEDFEVFHVDSPRHLPSGTRPALRSG